MVICDAVARRASTNLSSISTRKSSGDSVRCPNVCAAVAIPSTDGFTRTKKATTTSTRIRSLVMRLSTVERLTSSLRVFMLIGIISWKMGMTIAPPLITTFCPPSPVRTNACSADARRYRRAKMIPIITKTTTATMAVNIHEGNMPKTSSIYKIPLYKIIKQSARGLARPGNALRRVGR